MRLNLRSVISILLFEALILSSVSCRHRTVALATLSAAVFNPLQEYF
jgi:hypothetical protein